jgi:hypothetical protein
MRQLIMKLPSKLVEKVATEFPASEVAGGHTIPFKNWQTMPFLKW